MSRRSRDETYLRQLAAGGAPVIAAVKLRPDVRSIVEYYQQAAGVSGSLLGAVHGSGEWDWRPLLLQRGEVVQIRFTDPALAQSPDQFGTLRSLYERLRAVREVVPGEIFGETEGRLWICRRYFPLLLSSSGVEDSVMDPLVAFLTLVERVQRLHRLAVIHGHVAPSNVAVDAGDLYLLDAALRVFSRLDAPQTDLASEVAAGRPATAASDIFGLGLVARRLLPDLHGADAAIVEAMVANDPSQRPSLGEVQAHFAGQAEDNEPVPQRTSRLSRPVIGILRRRVSGIAALAGVIACLFLAVVYVRHKAENGRGSSIADEASYEQFWKSGIPSLMQQVARAAIDRDDRVARMMIVQDALAGKGTPGVHNDLLRIAFNPMWEGELSADDRRVALTIALGGITSRGNELEQLPPLSEAHPGVVLAISGTLRPNLPLPSLHTVDVSMMGKLPQPFGPAFRDLARTGIQTMGDEAARALSHIVVGDHSRPILEFYFPENDKDLSIFVKLGTLLPLIAQHKELGTETAEVLSKRYAPVAAMLTWFTMENVVGWESVDIEAKLSLVAGLLPRQNLKFEQYCDLLLFPRESVREKVRGKLVPAVLPQAITPMLSVLTGEQSRLSRAQHITLLSALRLKRDAQFPFLAKWFSTKPDPGTVAALLAAQQDVSTPEPFIIEAAGYLARSDWQADVELLKKLLRSNEPMVRALAYGHLRIDNPEQLGLLKAAVHSEPDAKLRGRLEERLGGL